MQICIIIKEIHAGTEPSKAAISNEFSKQHQHQSIKKVLYIMLNSHFFGPMRTLYFLFTNKRIDLYQSILYLKSYFYSYY